ncbi:MAG: hypothetical protein CM1200mP40_35330 [Gammaproteobacteria bacterium]|nr:MAG: hypothetical protein CM1200mP40_35330 [Gammaproteobacteria bacterium]
MGEVQSVEKHPNADKLSLCAVTDGVDIYQVVCGGENVVSGMKAPFAKVGAEIIFPGKKEKPFEIKGTTIRGIESNGMLCSAEELGLEEKSEGILELPADVTLGEDVV